MHKLIIFILISCTSVVVTAQTFFVSKTDSILRASFANGNYKNVMHLTDSLHKTDAAYFDTYQLAAAAAYLDNKMFKQNHYLKIALQNAPADSITQTHLFYNYLATQQYAQAQKMQHQLVKSNKMLASNKVNLTMLQTDAGVKISSDKSLYNNMWFGFIGAAIPLKSILSYHAITYLNQKNPFGDINQIQYYLNLPFALKKGWQINLATHLIHYNITNYNPLLINDQLATATPILVGGGISKHNKNVQYSLNAYYSNLNQQIQFQIVPSVLYYPFSNTKLSMQLDVNYLTEKNHLAPFVQVVYLPTTKLKITAGYTHANAKNYSELNGLLVNNSFDATTNRYALNVAYQLTNRLGASVVTQLENKTETYTNYAYQYFIVGLGIKYTF